MNDFGDYESLLAEARAFHGGACAGIMIGTRMTMRGLTEIGIRDPKGEDRKKLIVFVEIDRCCTDAVMALTGCRPGKRSMKIRDYGKMAATFINLESGKAVRVAMKKKGNPQNGTPAELPDFATVPDEELFTVREVEVTLLPEDMPGKPLRRVTCDRCGENVMDGREVIRGDASLCRTCDMESDYYRVKESVQAGS